MYYGVDKMAVSISILDMLTCLLLANVASSVHTG